MELDHVLVAVADPATGVPHVPQHEELTPYVGGRHPGWGTANWIVPLGDTYLELVAIVDEREARESTLGRWVATSGEGAFMGWCVRPSDLEATATRLGLDITTGSRTLPSRESIAWRTAGVAEATSRPWLPFFIERIDPTTFPGAQGEALASLVRLEIDGDPDELSAWLGDNVLPLDVRAGKAGITAVVLRGPRGTITLGRTSAL